MIVKQSKLQTKYETPTNQLDISVQNQSFQEVLPKQQLPSSDKSQISNYTQPYPFLCGPQLDQQKNVQPVTIWEILFPQFSVKSLNFALFVFLALYFVATYLYYQLGPTQIMGCTLYNMGAKFTPKIQHSGHIHRLFVSIFLFGSILHVVTGLLTILMFGFILQNYLGSVRYFFLIIFSGITSNLMSAIIYPYYVSVGSSGIIFGVLTLHFSFLVKKYDQLGFAKSQILSLFTLLVIANFISLIDTKSIDIAVIFGGILGGGLTSFFFYQKWQPTILFRRLQYLSIILYIALNIILVIILFTKQIDYVEIEKWCN